MGKKGFHTPFDRLKDLALPEGPKAKPEPKPEPKPAPEPPPRTEPGEEQLFADEMAGVAPLADDPRGRLGAPAPPERPASRRAREEAEAYAELADLTTGDGPFDIAETDEHIEGSAPGIDRRLLRKLKKGDYALQGHADLHGMSSEEARVEVERFITAARAAGKRCVLIVHGRGLHSKDEIPILKERLKVWLTRGKIARAVLAFSTARRGDGGPGAVYVLLRK